MEPKPLGIVIPVYNEADTIAETLRRIRGAVTTPHTVYLVHDRPEDTTLPAAAPFRGDGMDISFIENPEGGAAHAIRKGLRTAQHDLLLVTMADLSDDPAVIDRMVARMNEGFHLVCGSRYMQGGSQEGGPLIKRMLSRLAGVSLFWLGVSPVHDITNSFKLYRKSMLEHMEITSAAGFTVGMEIAVKAIRQGYRVAEVPCSWTERTAGQSRFRLFRWLPAYLTWYCYALRTAITR
ncbi:MAG: glycosyltransferase [Nitrospiraceae bacterium]|nr:glycosyltransferase [Nitrospiraceae bacterium]